MLWNSYGIAVDTLKQLLDRELPRKERQRIREKVLACQDVRGLHDLRTRHSGDRTFVEFHLEVDSHLTIAQGHQRVVDDLDALLHAVGLKAT